MAAPTTTLEEANWAVDRATGLFEVWALVAAHMGLVGAWRLMRVCKAARVGAKEFLSTLPGLVVCTWWIWPPACAHPVGLTCSTRAIVLRPLGCQVGASCARGATVIRRRRCGGSRCKEHRMQHGHGDSCATDQINLLLLLARDEFCACRHPGMRFPYLFCHECPIRVPFGGSLSNKTPFCHSDATFTAQPFCQSSENTHPFANVALFFLDYMARTIPLVRW
jgi:hypothetical protein